MNLRLPLLFSVLVFVAMLAASAWAWTLIPAGQSIAIHFDLDGTPNGYAGKAVGLLALPLIALVVTGSMALVPRLEPRRNHLARSQGLFIAVWIGALLLLAFGHLTLVARALGHALPIERLLPALLGAFCIVMGRELKNCQSTFFVGIRTPWTLSSEEVWKRTHRLAGALFVATGSLSLLASAAPGPHAGMVVFLAGTLATVAVSVVASYFFWRRDA